MALWRVLVLHMFDLSSFFVMSQQPFVLPYIPFVAVLDSSFGLCVYVSGSGVGLG